MSLAAKIAVGRFVLREHPGREVAGLVPPVGAQGDVFCRGLEAGVGQGSRVAGEAIAAGCEPEGVGELVADEADPAVPEPEQVLSRKPAAALVVTEDPREPGRVLVRVDEDDRDVSPLEPSDHVLGRRRQGDDEQAVGPLAKGKGLEVLVALLDRLDVVDDEIELTVRESRVDTRGAAQPLAVASGTR